MTAVFIVLIGVMTISAVGMIVADIYIKKIEKEEKEMDELFRSNPENAGFVDEDAKAEFEHIFPEFAGKDESQKLTQAERTEADLSKIFNKHSDKNDKDISRDL